VVPRASGGKGRGALRNTKQARLAALRGQPGPALDALVTFAAAGDVGAAASAAELLAFEGRWEPLVPHALALLARPDAVHAGNVFDDMSALVRRAARELGDATLVERAAASVPAKLRERAARVLLADSPNLSIELEPEDRARFGAAVALAEVDKRFRGKPTALARHCFSLAVVFHVQDEILARHDPANPELHFDAAVSAARVLARRGDEAGAWALLKPKLHDWWPVDHAQVAPVVLLVHPLLAPLMTTERCRIALETPRAGQS
jgi:hypothetical protein